MKMVQSKIPEKKRILKDKLGNTYKIVAYEYDGEDSLDTSYVELKDMSLPSFAEHEIISFADLSRKFNTITGEKFAKLIEKYDEEYEESRITHIERYDEDERPLKKADWEKMLENLDMPRELYESRPVVCNDGLLCYNAATGCRVVGSNPKQGGYLYRAVEKKKKFKKHYWRYATREEIEEQIKQMQD